MKIKFLDMQLGIFKCFWKLILGFLYFPPSSPSVACPCGPAFAYSVVPSNCLWILDALLSLGLPESITEGNVGSIPHGIHPAKCPFLIKVLTLNSSVALWLCWDHQCLPLEVKQQTGKASFTSCQVLYCYCTTQVTT